MELLSMYSPPVTSILVLYILNRVFKYKDKLVKRFGKAKYKGTLLIILLLIIGVFALKYNITIFGSAIGFSIYCSYFYLIYI